MTKLNLYWADLESRVCKREGGREGGRAKKVREKEKEKEKLKALQTIAHFVMSYYFKGH